MILPLHRPGSVGLALMLAASIAGCAPEANPNGSPTGTSSASPTESSASPTDEGPRFLIECVDLEGGAVGPFTRLEEAWASTNYVRIDHCTASSATDRPVVLTPEEEDVARTAAADLPDEGFEELYLRTLATCVRVAPTSVENLSTLPTSLLRATLELCPDAPHAGLVDDELQTRSQ